MERLLQLPKDLQAPCSPDCSKGFRGMIMGLGRIIGLGLGFLGILGILEFTGIMGVYRDYRV